MAHGPRTAWVGDDVDVVAIVLRNGISADAEVIKGGHLDRANICVVMDARYATCST